MERWYPSSALAWRILVAFAAASACVTPIAHAAGDAPATAFKFDFGPGNPRPGFAQVPPDAAYADKSCYGFEPGSKVVATERAGSPHGGFVTADKPFFFSIAVPEGNYRVTVAFGDPAGESDTTVKAELRRLMLERIRTAGGKLETRSFVVNVRTPDYPGGKVRLKDREATNEAWAWDGKLTLEFNGPRPCVDAIEVERVDVPTVFILGDSTVCDQPKEPYASWGQMLPRFFKPQVAVANHAESGETVAGSASAHRFDKVLSQMKPGDYLLVQFGHNDMKSKSPDAPAKYKADLKRWVAQVKAKGGVPVLITPVNRHSFEGETITNSLRDYPDEVREAAREEGVVLIDLHAMSKTLYEALGPQPSIQLFKHDADLKKFDGTHHSPYGAYELARCVVEGIRQSKLDLAKHIADDAAPFDPAKPDAPEGFKVPSSPGPLGERPLGDDASPGAR